MRTIGVNTWLWVSPLDDAALAGLAAKAARMGFGAIELPIENLGDWSAEAAAAALDRHGLVPIVIGAMALGRNLVAAPEHQIAATQRYLSGCLATAQALGSTVVAGPFTAQTGRAWRLTAEKRSALYAELRESLAPLVDEAQDRGVRLAVEPLNRYETSLVNTVEQALDALGPLLGDGLGLCLDSYHLNIEEKDIGAAIRAAGPHIAHVQICGNDRGAVGDDHIDWPAFLDALDEAGYAGPLGLESFSGENAAIAVAASVWRPLAPSQDALAERSLSYLTRLQNERETR